MVVFSLSITGFYPIFYPFAPINSVIINQQCFDVDFGEHGLRTAIYSAKDGLIACEKSILTLAAPAQIDDLA